MVKRHIRKLTIIPSIDFFNSDVIDGCRIFGSEERSKVLKTGQEGSMDDHFKKTTFMK